jgi:hypothetical protein
MESGLWEYVETALVHHDKNTPCEQKRFGVLNRLFRKSMKRAKIKTYPMLNPNTCSIRKEFWTTGRLKTDLVPGHCDSKPRRLKEALISVKYKGKYYLIDGRNRVNLWISNGDDNGHEIILIEPRVSGQDNG